MSELALRGEGTRTRGPDHARVVLAAAAAWVALGAALLALPAPRRPAGPVRPVASHGATGFPWATAHRVYAEVDRRARRLGHEDRARIARVIIEEAARAELAPSLVLAVIDVESRFDPRAISPVGAVGLMQLRPPTLRAELSRARLCAADPFDPVTNVRAGVRYLARLLDAFGDEELALMAYNAGPNRIRRHLEGGGVPPRFLGYPREVLRRAERRPLRPRAAHASNRRIALVAAHAAPSSATAATRHLGTPAAEIESFAGAARRAPVPARPRTSRERFAYAPADGLPAGRGRDRPRLAARGLLPA